MPDWLYYASAIACGYVTGEIIVRCLRPLFDKWIGPNRLDEWKRNREDREGPIQRLDRLDDEKRRRR